jgi:Ca2+-dependent lipid-binding protein
LHPLIDELPIAQALEASFVYPPDVRFTLKALGGTLNNVPGLEAFLYGLVAETLGNYTQPESFLLPLANPDPAKVHQPAEGALRVRVVEARGLTGRDLLSAADAYCKLSGECFWSHARTENCTRPLTPSYEGAYFSLGFSVVNTNFIITRSAISIA